MRSIESEIRDRHVIRYVLCFPDDFIEETQSADLTFSPAKRIFTVAPAVSKGLQIVRDAQIANDQIEHGFLRLRLHGRNFILNEELTPLKGTETGLSFDVLQKDLYEGARKITNWIPFEILDFVHSHTKDQGTDPRIAAFFSPDDINSIGIKYGRRYWLIDPEGKACCLINGHPQKYGGEFEEPSMQYQSALSENFSYPNAKKAFRKCIKDCRLILYHSSDFRSFRR